MSSTSETDLKQRPASGRQLGSSGGGVVRPLGSPPAAPPKPPGFTAAAADAENTGYRDSIKESVARVRRLRQALEEWRHVLAPLYGVLVWRRDWHPPLLAAVVTTVFCVLWWLEPPLLTLVAILGMLLTSADYLVPAVCQAVFRAEDWTATQEREFERMCQLLADMYAGVEFLQDTLTVWKKERPNVYFCAVAFGLCVLAWLGNHLSNLALSFIVVQCVVLYPGLRQRGVLRRYLAEAIVLITSKVRPQRRPAGPGAGVVTAPTIAVGDHVKTQ